WQRRLLSSMQPAPISTRALHPESDRIRSCTPGQGPRVPATSVQSGPLMEMSLTGHRRTLGLFLLFVGCMVSVSAREITNREFMTSYHHAWQLLGQHRPLEA